MKLDPHVQTNNNIQTVKGKLGVCMAMTAEWIIASKRNNGVTRAWQIGTNGAFRINQAAGLIGEQKGANNLLKRAGLEITSEQDDSTLADLGTNGYHILEIWDTTRDKGHAMGTWVTQDKYQFFDPNFGLFHAKSSTGLISDVTLHCWTEYSDIDAEYIVKKIA